MPRAWRHTRGRPRAVLASDGQPVTLPLDTTIDDLADVLGPGAYRLRAVTAHGELLETSVDHEVVGDEEPAPMAIERRGSRTTREDITTLVNGLVEMGRSHARTSERLAEAQADWTKALATKIAPMHPTLGVILAAWKNAWPSLYGHEPTARDRVIGRSPDGKPEGSGTANPDLHADLRMLGLRVRDGHDMRHTFISICMNAGALKHVVETITHPKAVVRDAFEAYVNVSYEDTCAAVLKVDIDPPAWALALAGRGDRAPEVPASETAYADESEGQPASAVTTSRAQPCYNAATALSNPAESCLSRPKTVFSRLRIRLNTIGFFATLRAG
jgi:hypothetical protein